MKKEKIPGNVLSLTSDQIGEALANRFWKALKSGRKLYRDTPEVNEKLIPEELKDGVFFGKPQVIGVKKAGPEKSKRPTKKGHVSIRSQTGHDHDRNRHKY